MSWLGGDDRQAVMREVPDIAAPWQALEQSIWKQSHIPAGVLELCRLRLARLHRSEAELARRLVDIDADKRASLDHWERADAFTEGERACIAFTEVYAMDAQALTDAHAEAVKASYGDAGLVLLIEALGLLDGMTRLSLLWQLEVEGEGSV